MLIDLVTAEEGLGGHSGTSWLRAALFVDLWGFRGLERLKRPERCGKCEHKDHAPHGYPDSAAHHELSLAESYGNRPENRVAGDRVNPSCNSRSLSGGEKCTL